jgi:hypothetical protein
MTCVGVTRRFTLAAALVLVAMATGAATAGAAGLKLSPAGPALKQGTATINYHQILKASGGTGEYKWQITSGALPEGVALNEAAAGEGKLELVGAPVKAGTSTFTVEAATPTQSITREYTIDVQLLLPGSLGKATAGNEYRHTLESAGGIAPYRFAVTAGALPEGLELSESGQLHGMPTTAGTSTFAITVTDASEPAFTRTREYTLAVQLGLTPRSLPKGTVEVPYDETAEDFLATGGEGSYSYEIVSGELPPGLRLEGDDIYGTPELAGVYSFVLQATDSAEPAHTGSHRYTIRVNAGSGPPLGAWKLGYAMASEPENTHFDGFTLEAGGNLHDEDGAPGHWTYKPGHLTFTLELAGGSVVYEYVGTGSGTAGPFSGTYYLNSTPEGTFTFTHE